MMKALWLTLLLACSTPALATEDGLLPPDPAAPAESSASTSSNEPERVPVRASFAPQAHRDIERVLAGPDFKQHEDGGVSWRLRHLPEPEKPQQPTSLAWLRPIIAVIAFLFSHILWVLLAIFIALVLWHGRRWVGLFKLPERTEAAELAAIQHRRQPVAEVPLPADVAAEAEVLWRGGDVRAALSLLYRGAVQSLRSRTTPPLPDSATERENLMLVRASQAREVAEDFALIVRAWQAEAYAGQHPADFPALLQSFRRRFAGARA